MVFEIAARLFFPWPLKPGMVLELNNRIPNAEGNGLLFKEKVKLDIDGDFLRKDGWTTGDKPAGTVRIFCIGGWATMGMLQNTGDTWWGQLRAELEKGGQKVEMAALGSERTELAQVVNRARPVIEQMKPDIIIVNSGFDDIIAAPVDYKYDPAMVSSLTPPAGDSGLKALVMKTQSGRAIRSWRKGNEAARLQNEKGRKDYHLMALKAAREQVQKLPVAAPPSRDFENDPLKTYLDGLKLVRDLAKNVGASVILTGEASLHDRDIFEAQESLMLVHMFKEKPSATGGPAFRPAPAWVAAELDRYGREAEKFAEENKLVWFDLNGKVGKLSENFYSDVMLTDAGAKEAARLLAPVVAPVVKERAGK